MAAYRARRILMLLENCSFPRDDRVRREARALTAAGFQVTVISPASPGQARREVVEGVTVLRFPSIREPTTPLGYVWEYLYTMAAIFLLSLYVAVHGGFDILHAHQPPDTLGLIGGLYKLGGKKYVLDHHDLAVELYDARFRRRGSALVRMLLILFERMACRLADHVIATNLSYRRTEMERDGVPEGRITVVRNGPDIDDVFPGEADPSPRRNGKMIIGYVGVTGVQDGVDYLLRAIHHLVLDLGRKDVSCLIVGNGNAMPSLLSLSGELGLGDTISFTGWVDGPAQLRRYLNSMDICVAPEPSDPYNEKSTAAKVMEYMAVGKPIVAFDLREHRFSAQDAAVYARPNDEMDFARKLASLMDSPEQRRHLGEAGLARVRLHLAWQHQAKDLIGLYSGLFGSGYKL